MRMRCAGIHAFFRAAGLLIIGVLIWCALPSRGQSDTTSPYFVFPGVNGELGQTIEGQGSANFAWLRYPGYKMGVAFSSPRDGAVTNITLLWKSSSGYGAGRYGVYAFEIRTDGAGHFPSEEVIGVTTGVLPRTAMNGRADGAFRFAISATLRKGEIYHLVIRNTDPNPGKNWSCPDGLMTRVLPWDGTGYRTSCFGDGPWDAWSSVDNPFNTTGGNRANGQHVPLMVEWADGAATGDPYYSSAISTGAYFYGNKAAGEEFPWRGENAHIMRIGVSVQRYGNPAGPLRFHLDEVGGSSLASGVIANAAQVGTIPTWVYADLPSPVTLIQDRTYRLWFDSPQSVNTANCYFQSPPYGENSPEKWLETGWGGMSGCYCTATSAAWTKTANRDLTFSLQAMAGGTLTDITVEAQNPSGTPIALTPPPAADDTDPAPLVTNDAPSAFPLGLTLVTWTATDAAGNTATIAQRVTVLDTTAPTIIAPPDVTFNLGEPVILGSPTVNDNADPTPLVTNNAPPVFPLGITEVTWTATDAAGNSASAVQKVTIVDGTPPTITAPPDVSFTLGETVILGSPTVSDNVDPAPTVTNNAPAVFPRGLTLVTWTATDAAGNSASAVQRVIVNDVTAPTIVPPPDITVEFGDTITLGIPIVFDDDDPAPVVSNNAPAIFPLGVTAVTWKARDATGNTSYATQRVTVTDNTPPQITPPPDVTFRYGEPVNLGAPTVTDNADPAPAVTNNAPPVFPVGITFVTWTATDSSGNSVSAVQKVTIIDVTPPTITAPPNVSVQFGQPVILGTPTVTDNADPAPVVTNNAPAVFPLGITYVTWTARDASGNSATALQRVTITDVTPPSITAPPDVTYLQGQTVILGTPTVTDNADPAPVVTNNAPPVFPLGLTTVTWTARDASGNTATAAQRVTINGAYAFIATVSSPTIKRGRGVTYIYVTLPVRAKITVTVRQGATIIKTLANGTYNAGKRVYYWNGTDSKSHTISAGVYTIVVEGQGVNGEVITTASTTVTVQ